MARLGLRRAESARSEEGIEARKRHLGLQIKGFLGKAAIYRPLLAI
jgi:hypothetical protein